MTKEKMEKIDALLVQSDDALNKAMELLRDVDKKIIDFACNGVATVQVVTDGGRAYEVRAVNCPSEDWTTIFSTVDLIVAKKVMHGIAALLSV